MKTLALTRETTRRIGRVQYFESGPVTKTDVFILLLAAAVVAVWHFSGPANHPRFSKNFFPRYHGIASWYSKSDAYIHWLTANGEVFDDADQTCASWDFPFGTYVKVTNIKNGKFVICRVNDRGPYGPLNRAIDLTKASFQKIADPDLGLAEVTITPLSR